MNKDKTVIVVAAVFEKEGRYLIAQRKNKLWEFPGGKVKYGETAQEALKREIQEELSCEINVGEAICVASNMLRDKTHAHIVFYSCKIKKGNPKAVEHRKIRWSRPDEMENLKFSHADERIISKLNTSL
jgi:8-oxo-dGTP diphosphatase